MCSSSIRGLLILAAACVLVAAPWRPARAQAPMRVCIDRSSPSAHLDRAVARAAAKAVSAKLEIARFDSGNRGEDGFGPTAYRRLAHKRCDLIMGFPLDPTSPSVPAGLKHTPAYLHTGFVLMSRTGRKLSQLSPGASVAVTYMSPPDLYLDTGKQRFRVRIFNTQKQVLQALAKGRVNAAAVWELAGRQYERTHRHAGPWKAAPLSISHARWEIVALYAPRASAVAQRFRKGLARVRVVRPAAANKPLAVKVAGGATARSGPAGNDPPQLYTRAQARHGAGIYAAHCARCHGAKLGGLVGPPLKGTQFASPGDDMTVGSIFGFFSSHMPMDNPGSLSHRQYVELMAFLLRENGYPSGNKALTWKRAQSSNVKLVAR